MAAGAHGAGRAVRSARGPGHIAVRLPWGPRVMREGAEPWETSEHLVSWWSPCRVPGLPRKEPRRVACTQTVAPRFWRPGAPGPGASRGVSGTCPRPRSWTCGWPSPPGVVTRSSLCVSVPGSPLMRTPVHTGLGHLTTSVQARFQVQAHPKELGLRPPTRPQWGSPRVFAIEEKWGDL